MAWVFAILLELFDFLCLLDHQKHLPRVDGSLPFRWHVIAVHLNVLKGIERHTREVLPHLLNEEFHAAGLSPLVNMRKGEVRFAPTGVQERGFSIRVRKRVVMARVRRRLRAEQRRFILEASGETRSFFMDSVLPTVEAMVLRISGYSPEVAGMRRRVLETLPSIPLRSLLGPRITRAVIYAGVMEREGCCWGPWDEERIRSEFLDLVAALEMLRSRRSIEMHLLHCRKVRGGYWLGNGRKMMSVLPYQQAKNATGLPFGEKHGSIPERSQPFHSYVYGMENLKALAGLVEEGTLKRDFVFAAIRHGVILPPKDYVLLSEGMARYELSLEKCAWLYHHGVPIEQMALCAELLVLCSLRQAKVFTREGVLPEFLGALQASFPAFSKAEVVEVHRCAAHCGYGRVLAVLAAFQGESPSCSLQTLLFLIEQFPSESVEAIRQRALRAREPREIPSAVSARNAPALPTRRGKRKGRQEERRHPVPADGARPEQPLNERVHPSLLPRDMKTRQLEKRLLGSGWLRTGGRGSHKKFELNGRVLTLPLTSRGTVDRCTLADALSQAAISKGELQVLLS